MRRVVRGADIVTMDPAIGELRGADILIDEDRIAAVGHNVAADDAEIVDGTGMIAVPGFVNAHAHLWQALLRGVASDLSFRSYFSRVLRGLAWRLTAEDVAIAHEVATLEALHVGITSVFDWSHIQNSPDHTDEIVRVLRSSGLRVVFGYGPPGTDVRRWLLPSSTEPHNQAEARRLRADLSDDDALVTLALGLRGPEYVSWSLSETDIALARELDVPAMFHMGDPRLAHLAAMRGLRERGLLGPDLIFGNCFALSDDDIATVRDSGGRVVSSPEFGMQIGQGLPPVDRLLAAGLAPGIGADALVAFGASPFALMRLLIQTTRLTVGAEVFARTDQLVDEVAMTCRQVLGLMTIDGARAIGLGDRTGSITPGKQADLVLLDASAPNMFPVTDLIASVVQYADAGNVDTVFVAGRLHKQHGRLVRRDLAQVRTAAQAASERLLDEATRTGSTAKRPAR